MVVLDNSYNHEISHPTPSITMLKYNSKTIYSVFTKSYWKAFKVLAMHRCYPKLIFLILIKTLRFLFRNITSVFCLKLARKW